jgi:hypothetical protein
MQPWQQNISRRMRSISQPNRLLVFLDRYIEAVQYIEMTTA